LKSGGSGAAAAAWSLIFHLEHKMSRTTEAADLSKRRLFRLWACLSGGLVLASAAGAGQPSGVEAGALGNHGPSAATSYRVINLRPASDNLIAVRPMFNARDQLALSTEVNFRGHGWFYDGTSLVDIGSLNGGYTDVTGINNAGQVVGDSFIRDIGGEGGSGEIYHAFVWSKSRGMRDLGTLGGMYSSGARAINNLGQVTGIASAPDGRFHAFRWSASEGMLDLGLLSSRPDARSTGTAINDAGTVVGVSETTDGNFHAFLWTRAHGLRDLGTLGGKTSTAVAIGAEGQVAGMSAVRGLAPVHAFIWTRDSGMRDVGPRGTADADVRGMSANGHMYGVILPCSGGRRAFSWTRATGMIDIGTLGGTEALANAGNNRGQVVGGSFTRNNEDFHAFVWSAKEGIVDLNGRLRHAPAGLVLRNAYAISDNGLIVAESNAGVVLLLPDGRHAGPHTVGPIAADELVQVNRPFESSVSFSDADTAAAHNVLWNWGDGSGDQQGNARESNGAGVASANHVYAEPGIYTVSAQVGDRSGKGPTVSRTIVVYDPQPGAAGGSGWFISPHGAHKTAASQGDKAVFSFVLPSAASAKGSKAAPRLDFSAKGLNFRSDDFRLVARQGSRVRFDGSGTLNGTGNYLFTLNATAGLAGGEPRRFGLKIWHVDPVTRATVVDYDNQGTGSDGAGSVFHGEVLVH
jgi:probable HAF family extracellular repeat protein